MNTEENLKTCYIHIEIISVAMCACACVQRAGMRAAQCPGVQTVSSLCLGSIEALPCKKSLTAEITFRSFYRMTLFRNH